MTTKADPGSKDNRIGSAQAVSWYFRDKVTFDGVTIVPGVRVEDILLTRTDYSNTDPDRKEQPEIYETAINVVIPGVGLTYRYAPGLTVVAGVHKGFTPPGPGKAGNAVKAEESLNSELGLRIERGRLILDGLVFMNRYDNMLGADLLATGGEGTGDQFNGGEVDVFGVELSGSYSARTGGYTFPLRASYTYTNPEFRNSFSSAFNAWGTVDAGDKLPYIAAHQLFAESALEAEKWSVTFSGKYTSAMRTQAGQGPVADSESIEAAFIFDLSGEYSVVGETRLYFTVRNVTDQVYIVAQRPAGVRPGLPRTLSAGVRFAF
ncbi:MAG: TonB-dependent receptor [Candidatus Marinimicrobia bacterium]|nr:TonB-dependent receptor [Candidatus Neomarinimicrobiota bacterium]